MRRERRNAPPVPVCSCAHFSRTIAHETAGAASIRRSLRPLFGRNDTAQPGRSRRGNADAYPLGCLKCEQDSLRVIARSMSDDAIHLPARIAALMRSSSHQFSVTSRICASQSRVASSLALSSGPVQFVKLYGLPNHRCTVVRHLLQVKRPISVLGFRLCVAW